MEFDRFTAVLLESRPDAPHLTEDEANALQDAHMDHLATLHEAGSLLAAGPFPNEGDSNLRGLCLFRLPPEEVRSLLERDPAVQAGRLSVRVLDWMVPQGAVQFSPAVFPHSLAEL
jgi:uncharacterized protein YciI